jgi:hypothetical protein
MVTVAGSFAYLKNVKSLILNHLTVIAQELHAEFKVLSAFDISHHHTVVGAV